MNPVVLVVGLAFLYILDGDWNRKSQYLKKKTITVSDFPGGGAYLGLVVE